MLSYAFLGAWLRAGEGVGWLAADTMPDWQPRILLGMVEARSVNVKKTTTLLTGRFFI